MFEELIEEGFEEGFEVFEDVFEVSEEIGLNGCGEPLPMRHLDLLMWRLRPPCTRGHEEGVKSAL